MKYATLSELMDGLDLALTRATMDELMADIRVELATCKASEEEEGE